MFLISFVLLYTSNVDDRSCTCLNTNVSSTFYGRDNHKIKRTKGISVSKAQFEWKYNTLDVENITVIITPLCLRFYIFPRTLNHCEYCASLIHTYILIDVTISLV